MSQLREIALIANPPCTLAVPSGADSPAVERYRSYKESPISVESTLRDTRTPKIRMQVSSGTAGYLAAQHVGG